MTTRKSKIQQKKMYRKSYKGRITRNKETFKKEDREIICEICGHEDDLDGTEEGDRILGEASIRIKKECKLISEEEWYKKVGMDNN